MGVSVTTLVKTQLIVENNSHKAKKNFKVRDVVRNKHHIGFNIKMRVLKVHE